MTDFQAGDRIQYKIKPGDRVRVSGAPDLTLAYYGSEFVVFTWAQRESRHPSVASGEAYMTRREFDAKIEKIVPFFEVGKTYTGAGDVFTPTVVEADSTGNPVAFGRVTNSAGHHSWVTKRRSSYMIWEEV